MSKYLQIVSTLLISLLLLASCKSKQYTFDTYEGDIIAIGSSGGFTGAKTKYYIFENGQIFKNDKSGKVPLPTLDRSLMKQQFNNYYSLGFDKMEINDPGNMSYFIIMNPNTENVKMLKWGGGTTAPSKELEQYYNLLSAIIKKNEISGNTTNNTTNNTPTNK